MRKFLFLALALLALVPVTAYAQATSTQQSASRLDACNASATATGAGNTSVVATLTPTGGNSVYVCFIDIEVGANAAVTGGAVVQACVTTGLSTNLTFAPNNTTLVIGDVRPQSYSFASPIKGAAGAAFALTCSGLQSTQTLRINIIGYYAP
jgi:hypothetical protein